ncbi:MAG: hypothetical protein JF612_11715 [Planctomycetia bacterium]|nr:hypothetical protein [Planctomycetia bacterium]
MLRPVVIAVCLAAAVCLPAVRSNAEIFILKSGGRIEGEHLNPNRERGQPYYVRTESGVRLALADSAVARMIVKSELDKQYEALAARLENTVEGHWNMAEWCKEAGLSDQRKRHLQAVIALDPNHEDARKALGYQRFGSRWLTLDQIVSGGRMADAASRSLNALQDPNAAPALAEVLGDSQQPRAVRKRCLDILATLPTNAAIPTLCNVAMSDSDGTLQDGCLDLLKQQGANIAVPFFINELKSKSNARINRAADCLARLGDKSATLPLINALVTEHRETVSMGGGAGSISAGPGGFSTGKSAMVIKKRLENSSVRSALSTLSAFVPLIIGCHASLKFIATRAFLVATK